MCLKSLPSVCAAAVGSRMRLAAEGQSLVDRDSANAELARLLDHRQSDLVVEEEAFAVRTPLRIGFPRRDRIARGQLVHALEVARLIGIDAAVQEHPMRS